jgi:hypothetical protein
LKTLFQKQYQESKRMTHRMGIDTGTHTSDVGRTHRELFTTQQQKDKQPVKTWEKVLNRHFSKDDIQMAST